MLAKILGLPSIKILITLLIKTPVGILSVLTNKPKHQSPASWEFSVYSAGGEDGILNYLHSLIINPNQYFVEIGASNGVANNTAFFALAKKHTGLMVEGNKRTSQASKLFYSLFNKAVFCMNSYVSLKNIDKITKLFHYPDPDILSLDIDGNDYYILKAILQNGILPKVIVVEYNATMGPDAPLSIPYTEVFDYSSAHPTRLYYGASFAAWNLLLESYNYSHITVDSLGVNSFFARQECLTCDLSGLPTAKIFRDNYMESKEHAMNWAERFKLISNMPYERIVEL
jgi:hypothetical protein